MSKLGHAIGLRRLERLLAEAQRRGSLSELNLPTTAKNGAMVDLAHATPALTVGSRR